MDNIVAKYYYPLISGRYIVSDDLNKFYQTLSTEFKIEIIGKSVLGEAIKSVEIGNGTVKILMWSQMHGNESTTTKAVIDLLNFLNSDEILANQFKEHFKLLIIPMLNPDGAKAYTRVNANEVDLNRDSVNLTQQESILLRRVFDDYKPNFAFNLHDQRTIFSAGNTSNPATISFLSPSYNEERDVNEVRLEAMQLIVLMYKELQKYIPNMVGRFDDAFNLNCIGDRFQSLGVPTILFEAGHYPKDYQREETRKIVFRSLLTVLLSIKDKNHKNIKEDEYLEIPENSKRFNDILFTNIIKKSRHSNEKDYIRVQYKEVLNQGNISFEPLIISVNNDIDLPAHLIINEVFEWKYDYYDIENEIINKNLCDKIDITLQTVNNMLKK